MKKITIIIIIFGIALMAWWLKKKDPEWRKIALPGEIGFVSIPAKYNSKMEDDHTLLVYPDDAEVISLRFSSFSFVAKEGSEKGGIDIVREESQKKNYPLQEFDDKAVVFHE